MPGLADAGKAARSRPRIPRGGGETYELVGRCGQSRGRGARARTPLAIQPRAEGDVAQPRWPASSAPRWPQ